MNSDAFAGWSLRYERFPNTGKWTRERIPLDLRRALTLTATISATLPQQANGRRREVWHDHHERVLSWRLEDTLDGESWFVLSEGSLSRTAPSAIARVSSPMGSEARLSLRAVCVIASIRIDNASTQFRNVSPGDKCGFDHSGLVVTDVAFRAAVRSI